ncbi:unnamed protein product [Clonostachys rosea f. rosea IK726]|uniref:Uncharacterized protein n=2 Tax=Bionectria ochroleuca TaxID=29856 RepID=A0A0B7JIT0_BIOOC|nr:unnamed protein product [Clonostachys rosea f. rosea IK726]
MAAHACFRAQCGICGRALVAGDRFIPLIGGELSPESPPCLKGAEFPRGNEVAFNYHGRTLCWRHKCAQCKHASRAVGVHSDCFVLFQRECALEDALDRLWVAVLSRSPWWFALNARVDGRADCPLELVHEKADKLGLSAWRLLPRELTDMIQDSSESALFWLYLSALSFIRDLSGEDSSDGSSHVSVPLSNVLAWTRGSAPIFTSDEEGPPIVRLTSDCRGLKRVERLDSKPLYQDWRSDTMEFAIQDANLIQSVIAQFKYNILRLETPDINHGFHIWDMPNPPLLEDCKFSGHIGHSMRFSTIDLHVVTGLTFFFSHNKIYAVHPHTPSSPDATKTFNRFSRQRRASLAWVYLPLPRGDEIISFGIRLKIVDGRTVSQMPCFMFRTKLAGEIILGPLPASDRYQDVVLVPSSPKLLIHNNTNFGPITVFGAFAPERDDSVLGFLDAPPSNIPSGPALFSSVSLESVACIEIFEGIKTGTPAGILFHYENGAQRAVGNCRIGLDSVQTYIKPTRLCWQSISKLPNSMRAIYKLDSGNCSTKHQHRTHLTQSDIWVCMALGGTKEFWFSQEDSSILIHHP